VKLPSRKRWTRSTARITGTLPCRWACIGR
jgi:hypothetical protein